MVHKVVHTLLDVPPWFALLIIAALVFGEAALFFGFAEQDGRASCRGRV